MSPSSMRLICWKSAMSPDAATMVESETLWILRMSLKRASEP